MVLIMPKGTFHDEVLFMMVVRPIRCCLGIAIGARVFVDVHRAPSSAPVTVSAAVSLGREALTRVGLADSNFLKAIESTAALD